PLRILVEARASLDTLNLVLSGGADPNSKDKLAVTPLHAALRQKDFQTAGLLLAAKADPFAPDSSGEIPIKLVLKDPVALKDFVMTAGINAADIRNEGFLFYAVKAGDRDAVQVLLDLGIDKARRNISGETAFDIANAKGLTEIAAILQ
ncbi:MAG: ankyrin repeat domain-containing protein, partial [Spirochaetia bacterium]|nr:ankyrin repeat domain-containing protein [Spirochaetia bacterium]